MTRIPSRHVAALVVVTNVLLLVGVALPAAGQNATAEVSRCNEMARASSEGEFLRLQALQDTAPEAVSREALAAAALNFIAQSEACYQELVGKTGEPIDDGGVWITALDADPFNTYGTKWGGDSPFSGGQDVSGPGTAGGTVTYSFMASGIDLSADSSATGTTVAITSLPTYDPCFLTEFTTAFSAWSTVANIQFTEVADTGEAFNAAGAAGDIRFAGHVFDGSSGTLAHQFYPPPNGSSAAGDGHFDVAENWSCSTGSGLIDFGLVAMHEIGHGIGLKHEPSGGATAIMNPFYNSSLSGLQADDIDGAVSIYGATMSAPTVTSDGGDASASVSAAENQTAVTDVEATDNIDSEGAGLTYSMTGGADQARFTLNATSGLLTFTTAPDFESPGDAGTDNVYDVQVTATDSHSLTDAQDLAVTVTNVNEAPAISSNDGGTSAAVSVAENQTAVTDVETTDDSSAEGAGLTYSKTGGADQSLFTLDTTTGVLTFTTAPDFETPGDAPNSTVSNTASLSIPGTGTSGTASVYPSTITVADTTATLSSLTVTLTGFSHTFPGDLDILLVGPTGASIVLMSDVGGTTDASSVNLTFSDTGASLTPNVSGTYVPTNEDSGDSFPSPAPSGTPSSALSAFTGTNPSGTWSLYIVDDSSGDTGSLSGGWSLELGFSAADNVYNVQVTVTDAGSLTDTQDLAITVTNVNEAPAISSNGGGTSAAVSVAENQTAVTDVATTDDTSTEGAGLTYSKTGGADQGLFTLNATTGVLTFTTAPDYEAPGDTGTDNVYNVQVTVTDAGSLTDVQDLAITVTDENDGGFYDDPLLSGAAVRAIHFQQLRTRIDALRSIYLLTPATWTDDPLVAGTTVVKAVHLTEMRTALDQAYAAASMTSPTYTDPGLTAGTLIQVVHITELRQFVITMEARP